jgi:hypothetical protein
MLNRRFLFLRALAIAVFGTCVAHAQITDPKVAFAEGERAYLAGDYRGAAESFELAYTLRPHYSVLWNAAKAWERNGDLVRAANLLDRYLRDAPKGAPDRDNAVATLTKLDGKLARVEVRGIDVHELRIDGEKIESGMKLYVTPGDHDVRGLCDSIPVRRTVRVDPGMPLSVTLECPVEARGNPYVAPNGPNQTEPKETTPQARKGLPPFVFFGLAGLTVVSAGVSVWSGLDTASQKETFVADRSNQSNYDSAVSAQTRTNVLLATTGVFAIATVVVAVVTQWRSPKPVAWSSAVTW